LITTQKIVHRTTKIVLNPQAPEVMTGSGLRRDTSNARLQDFLKDEIVLFMSLLHVLIQLVGLQQRFLCCFTPLPDLSKFFSDSSFFLFLRNKFFK